MIREKRVSDTRTAAIIPYACDEITGTIYVLLARSTFTGSWGDLGGALDAEDGGDVRKAAAREFCEECLCSLQISFKRPLRTPGAYYKNVERDLMNGVYTCRIEQTLQQKQDTPRGVDNTIIEYKRVFFLKRVPFNPKASTRFSDSRRSLQDRPVENAFPLIFRPRHNILSFQGEVPPRLLEKDRIKWFSVDHLVEVLQMGKGSRVKMRTSFRSPLIVAVQELLKL
jgi:hypothetical protein